MLRLKTRETTFGTLGRRAGRIVENTRRGSSRTARENDARRKR
jgi:hypothetical protein